MTKGSALLFVCTNNSRRSRSAEAIYAQDRRFVVKSASISPHPDVPLSVELLGWSDLIVVMEAAHESVVRAQLAEAGLHRPVFRLNIPGRFRVPEDYRYMEPALVALIRRRADPILDLWERMPLLADDLRSLQADLDKADPGSLYDFPTDLRTKMRSAGLTANALAERCLVSHPAVGKWLAGTARPHGKERFKEVGMALGLDAGAVSALLLANDYPPLSSKNPFDAACKRTLRDWVGSEDVVRHYRELLAQLGIAAQPLSASRKPLATELLSQTLASVTSTNSLASWMEDHWESFEAGAKVALPSQDLIRFIVLHLSSPSLNELHIIDGLPDAVRRLLSPIRAGRQYAVRGLREKLILFGMYTNMTDDDLNRMLAYARLAPLVFSPQAKSSSRIDQAILAAMRSGHERCPYYEYSLVRMVVDNIVDQLAAQAAEGEELSPELVELKNEYRDRFRLLRDPYSMPSSAEFEDVYADHLSAYVVDLLWLLGAYGQIPNDDIAPYLDMSVASTESDTEDD